MCSCQMPCGGGHFHKGPKSIYVRRSLALATMQVSRWSYTSSECFKGINTYDFHVASGSRRFSEVHCMKVPLHLFRCRSVVVTPGTRGTIALKSFTVAFVLQLCIERLHAASSCLCTRSTPCLDSVGCATYLLVLSVFSVLPLVMCFTFIFSIKRPFVSFPQSAGLDAIC
ncbi:hypothetical protein EDD16DRAFT_29138 [Pisolithus croceorrhizus]|nr:hypothetical protein EDD16DRAFT_29138 [Pisolithus croceorrhizus]